MKIKSEHIWIVAGTVAVMTVFFAVFLYVSKTSNPQPPFNKAATLSNFVVEGTVAKYGSNPDRDIDKMLLRNNQQEQWLHFPPHTAKAVLSVARIGDAVETSVQNSKKPAPDGSTRKELLSVTAIATGKVFSVQHIPPPPPSQGTELTIHGNILGFITDEKGNTRSVIVDHWLVALPPHARDALLPLLAKDRQITVKGWARKAEAGFVNEDSLTVIRPYAVVINGTQYSIQ